LIGIFLERKVPRSVRMLENLHRLSLPGGQERVALLLALGRSEEQIALELSLTHNTVVYHRRQIYNRLDISNRSSLVAMLSEPASLGSIRPTPD
jgi:DNA-binding NarL/FixJ family response regulator